MDVHIACPCPPKDDGPRHPDGDTVTIRDRLPFHSVVTIRKAMALVDSDDETTREALLLATCTEFYMLMGIEAWSLVDELPDEKGKDVRIRPVPVSHAAIRQRIFELPDVDEVSEAAEKLYNPVVLLPLVARGLSLLAPTPTPESTSPTPTAIRPKRPKPSKRSLTSISPTAVTEMTSSSLDGVSRSSANSVSAA